MVVAHTAPAGGRGIRTASTDRRTDAVEQSRAKRFGGSVARGRHLFDLLVHGIRVHANHFVIPANLMLARSGVRARCIKKTGDE